MIYDAFVDNFKTCLLTYELISAVFYVYLFEYNTSYLY